MAPPKAATPAGPTADEAAVEITSVGPWADAQEALVRPEILWDSVVDVLVNEWNAVLPDLSRDVKATTARIARLDTRIRAATTATLKRHHLLDNEFRVLAGLLRSGKPHRCNPSALAERYVPVTSGGLTGLVNWLERRGLVKRVSHPSDQRSVFIELTRSGKAVARAAMADFADVEKRLMAGISAEELHAGNVFLRRLLRSIEQRDV